MAALALSLPLLAGLSGLATAQTPTLPNGPPNWNPVPWSTSTSSAAAPTGTVTFGPWFLSNITYFAADQNSLALSYVDLNFRDDSPSRNTNTHCSLMPSFPSRQFQRQGDGRIYVPCKDPTVVVAFDPDQGAFTVTAVSSQEANGRTSGAYGSASMESKAGSSACGSVMQQLELSVPVSNN